MIFFLNVKSGLKDCTSGPDLSGTTRVFRVPAGVEQRERNDNKM